MVKRYPGTRRPIRTEGFAFKSGFKLKGKGINNGIGKAFIDKSRKTILSKFGL